MLLVMVGMPLMAGLTLGGLSLLKSYRSTRATVVSPWP